MYNKFRPENVVLLSDILWPVGASFSGVPVRPNLLNSLSPPLKDTVVNSHFVLNLRRVELLVKLHLRATGCHYSLAIWDHTVLSSKFHPTQVNIARLNPQQETGTQFTYPGDMEG